MDSGETDTRANISDGSIAGLLAGARPAGASKELLQVIGRKSFTDLGQKALARKMFLRDWMDAILRNSRENLNLSIDKASFNNLKKRVSSITEQLSTSLASFSPAQTMLALKMADQINHLEGYVTSDNVSQTGVNLYLSLIHI